MTNHESKILEVLQRNTRLNMNQIRTSLEKRKNSESPFLNTFSVFLSWLGALFLGAGFIVSIRQELNPWVGMAISLIVLFATIRIRNSFNVSLFLIGTFTFIFSGLDVSSISGEGIFFMLGMFQLPIVILTHEPKIRYIGTLFFLLGIHLILRKTSPLALEIYLATFSIFLFLFWHFEIKMIRLLPRLSFSQFAFAASIGLMLQMIDFRFLVKASSHFAPWYEGLPILISGLTVNLYLIQRISDKVRFHRMAGVITLLFVTACCYQYPEILVFIWMILLFFDKGKKLLEILTCLGLVTFMIHFYYYLPFTLLQKSLSLGGIGALFLATAKVLSKRRSSC